MSAATRNSGRRPRIQTQLDFDPWLLFSAVALLAIGLVMVSSASMHLLDERPWYFTQRQLAYVAIGVMAGVVVSRIRLVWWERWGGWLLCGSMVALVLVLVPGVGHEANGARRWLDLAVVKFQVSELVKLVLIVYLAGYLVRRGQEVRQSALGFFKPLLVAMVISGLLLMEPDFGAAVVVMATAMVMAFLGGARLGYFLVSGVMVVAGLTLLAVTSPYRMERLTSFLNPWADAQGSGYQLVQALIAIGRGEWFGVGLGSGVLKLDYLPEAHTDFVFAVLSEELGFGGALVVIGLFTVLVIRAFAIGVRAERGGAGFAAFLAYGIGVWLGMQAFINIGVNLGALPTKGLTLPLISYGGNSMVVTCVALALLLRVDSEARQTGRQAARGVVR